MLLLLYDLSFSSEDEDDDWCPPLPARTYLTDTSREELSSQTSKPEELSYTSTPVTSPQRDASKSSPHLQHFDLLARHHSGSQVLQSNPDLFTNTKARDASDLYISSQWADDFRGESLSKGQFKFTLMPHILGVGCTQLHSVM